jgi:hypothetical protein
LIRAYPSAIATAEASFNALTKPICELASAFINGTIVLPGRPNAVAVPDVSR